VARKEDAELRRICGPERTWLGGKNDREQGLRACHERLAAEPEGVERVPIGWALSDAPEGATGTDVCSGW